MKNASIFFKTENESHIISAIGVYRQSLYEEIADEKLSNSEEYTKCTDKILKARLEVQILNEACSEAYLYNCYPNWYIFFWPHFTKNNILRLTQKLFDCDDFIVNPNVFSGCFYIDEDELFIGICNRTGIISYLKISKNKDDDFIIVYKNKKNITSFFEVDEDKFDDICTICSFDMIVKKISEITKLPLDISFKQIKKAPKHMNAFRYRP